MTDGRPNNRPGQAPLRQRLRTQGTAAEAFLWRHLQRRRLGGFKFRRQFGVGPYVLGFYCPTTHLAVEVDGAIHEAQRKYDDARTRNLGIAGIRVIRFENRDVFERLDVVLAAILAEARRSGQEPPGRPRVAQGNPERWSGATNLSLLKRGHHAGGSGGSIHPHLAPSW